MLVLLSVVGMSLAPAGPSTARAADSRSEQSPKPGEITTAKAGFVSGRQDSTQASSAGSPLAAATPTAPFTECPPVGVDTGCALLVDVTDSGVTILQDASQGPYDGVEDTLIGVSNQSSKDLGHLSLGSNTDMFGFDGDGICSFEYVIDPGCPFGPTGYEGPGTSFGEISIDTSSGVVNFSPPVAPGGTRYFSLEEPLSASTVVSGGPSPIEQGGAPNRSERHTTCSTGHPVNCATGAFWHEFTDTRVPGRGVPLEFTRTYSSMNAAVDGPLGFGWSDSYDMSLSIDGETGAATVHEEGGSAVVFPANGEGGFTTPPRVLARLTANEDGTYSFSRFVDHIDYVFSAGGELLREVDRNGNATTLTYSEGLLEKVTDPSGRSLTFAYVGAHIHTITDPMGRTTTFDYEASGNLKEATDPMGRTWSFSYDGSHRLLTMTDPRGGTVSNSYDGSGRVIAQTDPMGRESTWQYEGEAATSEGGTTTFTNGRGDVTRYSYRDLELRSTTRGVGTASEATTSYEYDQITLGVTAVTDPNGNTTRNRYDGHGNLLETTDPLFRTTFYSYGPDDEVLSVTDPRFTTTEYRYDGSGNLLEKETPDFQTGETAITRYDYEAEPGELTSVTDPNGHKTTIGYDSAGDRTSVTDADGNRTTFAYNTDSELTSKVSPVGNQLGGSPLAHTILYAHNADGQLAGETDQLGHVTTYGYDGDGNQTTITDPNGHTTHQAYDADNELIEVIRPDASVLKTTWDAAGNMTAQVDGAGHTTAYGYDALGRVVSVTDPNGHATSYGYDPAGNRTGVTNAGGQLASYGYDADNELVSIFYSDGVTPAVSYEYDEGGNRVRLTDGTGTSTFTYDSLNRMTEATDGAGATVGYEHDLAGHLTKLTYPNGQSVTRAFDPAGNLTSVTDWLGHTTHFSYDADANLSEELYGNGVTVERGYDNADRLTSITDAHGPTQLASFNYARDPLGQVTSEVSQNGEAATTSYSRNSLDQLTGANAAAYGYDAGDNPTTFGAASQQFDPANELTSVSGPGEGKEEKEEEQGEEKPPAPGGGGGAPAGGSGGAPSPGSSAPIPTPAPKKALRCRKGFKKKKVHGKSRCARVKKKRHAHSKSRARTAARASRPAHAASPLDAEGAPAGGAPRPSLGANGEAGRGRKRALSAAAEVTRDFTYNARGDRITEELAGGGTRSLSYDQADHLIGVGSSISYTYNGDGLRTSKTVNGTTTAAVWNQSEGMPELLEAGSTSYVYGPDGEPIEQITGGAATFMQSDQQGSVRLLTDAAGAVVGRYDYDPWGKVTRHTGSAASDLQFDGQLTDAETGYQYLRARYYDPGTGQFVSADPLLSISRSRYGYAENNPLTFGDASGEWLGVDTLLGTAIGAVVGTVSGAGGYGVSVLTGNEKFSWRQLGASTAGGLIGGAAAGACEGTTWVGTVACGAAGGAIGGAATQFLSGHLPSAGDLLVGGLVGGAGGVVGKLLFPLRGFVPYKLSNVFKPGVNALRMYAQNAVGGLTGIVAQFLWC
jgi:RHS repeat-associated protein